MSYNLFLDDFRDPVSTFNYMKDPRYLKLEWIIVRDYDQFVKAIESRGIPQLVTYDHDLAESHYNPETWNDTSGYLEKTGLECAKYLINQLDGVKHPEYIVHSMNPVGKKNIINAIEDYNRYV